MDDAAPPRLETIRMLFELDREDDPRLYDDLVRFNKGTKRINRLRLLAHEGVLGQFNPAPAAAVRSAAPMAGSGRSGDSFDIPAAADVFDAPLEQ